MLSFLVFAVLALGDEPRQPRPGATLQGLADARVVDAAGKAVGPSAWKTHRAVVLAFLGTECPVSNFYAPQLEAFAREQAKRSVGVYGVYAEPEVTAEEARRHAEEYKLTIPLWLDREQKLADACGIRLVPEVVVLAPDGKLAYRGRIDDRFAAEKGKRRQEPRTRELADAVDAVLAGKLPTVQEAAGYGCPLTRKK